MLWNGCLATWFSTGSTLSSWPPLRLSALASTSALVGSSTQSRRRSTVSGRMTLAVLGGLVGAAEQVGDRPDEADLVAESADLRAPSRGPKARPDSPCPGALPTSLQKMGDIREGRATQDYSAPALPHRYPASMHGPTLRRPEERWCARRRTAHPGAGVAAAMPPLPQPVTVSGTTPTRTDRPARGEARGRPRQPARVRNRLSLLSTGLPAESQAAFPAEPVAFLRRLAASRATLAQVPS